jgi:glycosyltransferase involved in cell wall biosynthesis
MTARVSVVMASYNGERHVAQQLRSILGQSHPPVEIVIGDDGSVDRTLEVIEEVAAATPVPFRVTVNSDRLGYGENFMRSATRARGDFIAFADQDDVWYPRKLERAVTALQQPDAMLWVGAWTIVDDALRPVPSPGIRTGFAQRSALAYPMHVAHGTRMVLDASMLKYLPAEGRPISVYADGLAHQDEWAVFAAHVLGRIVYDPRPCMSYRRHSTSVSASAPDQPSKRWLLSRDGEAEDHLVRLAAADREAYLRRRAESPQCAPVKGRLVRAADYYEQLVPRLSRRVSTQKAASRWSRAASLGAALAHADHRPLRMGGLGAWNLLQDVYALAR